jgi:hypothetical protein
LLKIDCSQLSFDLGFLLQVSLLCSGLRSVGFFAKSLMRYDTIYALKNREKSEKKCSGTGSGSE